VQSLPARCAARGVALKWFGADDPVAFASRCDHWRCASPAALPQTDRVLAGLIDLRLPLTFTPGDAGLTRRILRAELGAVLQGGGSLPAPALVHTGDRTRARGMGAP